MKYMTRILKKTLRWISSAHTPLFAIWPPRRDKPTAHILRFFFFPLTTQPTLRYSHRLVVGVTSHLTHLLVGVDIVDHRPIPSGPPLWVPTPRYGGEQPNRRDPTRTNATPCCYASRALHGQPEWAPFASTARLVVAQPRFSFFSTVMYLLQSPVSTSVIIMFLVILLSIRNRCGAKRWVSGAAACTRWLGGAWFKANFGSHLAGS